MISTKGIFGHSTRRLMLAGVLAAWGAVATVLPASADIRDFQFKNSSGYVVDQLYVASSDIADWQEDILGADVLPAGSSVSITFGRYVEGTCEYDIKAVFTDQSSLEAYKFDLCTTSVVELGPDGTFYYS